MDLTNDMDNLLVSYILKETTNEQNEVVETWIAENAAQTQHYNELVNFVKLVGVNSYFYEVDIETEWQRMERFIKPNALADKAAPGEIIEMVSFEKVHRLRIRRWWVATAVAASVIFLAGLGWWAFNDGYKAEKAVVANNKLPDTSGASLNLKHEINMLATVRRIVLEDGSVVMLEPKSILSYHQPFINGVRNISLVGGATFKVFKDKMHPFTVTGGGLQTTALGTQFWVSAYSNDETIKVRLLEGKVVVKSVANTSKKMDKDYYLIPGQELVYYKRTSMVKISKFITGTATNELKPDGKSFKDELTITMGDKGNWFMFNNQSLSQVFDQLAVMFNADIRYNKEDVRKLYFIGKFNKTDSLPNILQQITSINNLKLKKDKDTYYITR